MINKTINKFLLLIILCLKIMNKIIFLIFFGSILLVTCAGHAHCGMRVCKAWNLDEEQGAMLEVGCHYLPSAPKDSCSSHMQNMLISSQGA